MVKAYLRISRDTSDLQNQEFEIQNFCQKRGLSIDMWTREVVSGVKDKDSRKLGELLSGMTRGDTLIVSEISRIGRNLLEVMSILHDCMKREIIIYTVKEGYTLGNDISSKVLAFAFSLSAEIERNLISQRTKQALALRKSQGVILGRPKGSCGQRKLKGKEQQIIELLNGKVSVSAIGRIIGAHRLTVEKYIKENKLRERVL